MCKVWTYLKGKSQMTSLLSTKNGSSSLARMSLDRARGPAVPRGSFSWEKVMEIPSLGRKTFSMLPTMIIMSYGNEDTHLAASTCISCSSWSAW